MTWTDKVGHKTDKITQADAVVGAFRLCVHHYMGCGDTWFFSVVHGPFNQIELKAKTLSAAKQEAGKMFSDCLNKARIDLEE
jgi:hypothetical protein